jgi:hypothetical protein
MAVVDAAVFGAAVSQDARQRNVVLVKERQHSIVQEVRRRDRRLLRVELRGRDLRIRIDEGLLIDAPDALEGADVERILRAAVPRALALKFAVRFAGSLGPFERDDLRLGEDPPFLRDLGLQRFQAFAHYLEIVALPHHADARLRNGEALLGQLIRHAQWPPTPAARPPSPQPPPRSGAPRDCGDSGGGGRSPEAPPRRRVRTAP